MRKCAYFEGVCYTATIAKPQFWFCLIYILFCLVLLVLLFRLTVILSMFLNFRFHLLHMMLCTVRNIARGIYYFCSSSRDFSLILLHVSEKLHSLFFVSLSGLVRFHDICHLFLLVPWVTHSAHVQFIIINVHCHHIFTFSVLNNKRKFYILHMTKCMPVNVNRRHTT